MYPVQLVKRNKPRPMWFIRAAPYTIFHPTENQIKQRKAFAEIVKKYKGLKGFDPETGLPIIAAMVKKEMSGKRFGRKVRKPKWRKLMENDVALRLITTKYRIARAIALVKLRGLA